MFLISISPSVNFFQIEIIEKLINSIIFQIEISIKKVSSIMIKIRKNGVTWEWNFACARTDSRSTPPKVKKHDDRHVHLTPKCSHTIRFTFRIQPCIHTRHGRVRWPDAGWPYTDGDCVRFRVDRLLIDVSRDRKNARCTRLNCSYFVHRKYSTCIPSSFVRYNILY